MECLAFKSSGYLTVGVFSSTERFNTDEFGSDKNDTLVSSQRLFYKISEMGSDQWEFTADIRNKYDAFGKLNKEMYQLDAQDYFQVRQLYLRMVNPEGQFSSAVGRFYLGESGYVFVDGLDLRYKITPDWYTGLFGGLNPKQFDKSYFVSDPKAQIAGAYLTYQKKSDYWGQNFYLTHGFVNQFYDNQTERQFLFHNASYQWEEDSRILSMLYLDFVPTTYIQTGNLIYQQKISNYFFSELGYLLVDVLEYQRRQNVLEKIAPSPYSEGHLNLDYRASRNSTFSLFASYGKRSQDQLTKTDVGLLYRLQNFITKNWDTQLRFIKRENFTSSDLVASWDIGYFSRNYEVTLDLDYGVQNNKDGTSTHPVNSELSLTGFISKTLFITGSFQAAQDETVTILGSFLKVGYRFGQQNMPPIRDGAAPRGSL